MNRFVTDYCVVVIGKAGVGTNIYLHGRDTDFTVEFDSTVNLDYIGQTGGYDSRGIASLGSAYRFHRIRETTSAAA